MRLGEWGERRTRPDVQLALREWGSRDYVGSWALRSVTVTAPLRIALLASWSRRLASVVPMANLPNRFARCCLTAAWEMTSSSAMVRVDAGSVNMSRARSGRHSATRTSRWRAVRAGGAFFHVGFGLVGSGRVPKQEEGLADADLVVVADAA
jgi:hypothetical protein